jgi:large subunit ribosomal protein L10
MKMSVISHERPAIIRKKREVEDLTKLIDGYNIIGFVQMENLSSRQLQIMKQKLKSQTVIKMAKNSIMKRALSRSDKPNIKNLLDLIQGSIAFVFTKMSGFELFNFLKENKTKAFAKPGAIAPKDIIIPAGNTGFQAGPMITELNEMGLKTKIVKGSIWIAEDTIVAKKGEEIPRKITILLSKLNIQPMLVGLDLSAIYEEGRIFRREDLDIDVSKVELQIQEIYSSAFNLSVNIAYPTKENISQLISVAFIEGNNLAQNIEIILPETISDIIAKAQHQANYLSQKIKEKNPDI